MSEEIRLSPDGERVLAEAQSFCVRANVAIVGAEHLLAGALVVLSESGNTGVPARRDIEAALMLAQGHADDAHGNQVMFGSGSRDAINATAKAVGDAGGTLIKAATLALGTIDSGAVSPMFYQSLGTSPAALRAAIASRE